MLPRFLILFLLFSSSVFVFGGAVLAGEKDKKEETPLSVWIAAENALIDKMSDDEKETFFILRNKYSVIRTIKIVDRDVGAAVKMCAEKNPALKDEITGRFADWERAVLPILSNSEDFLKKEIETQSVVKPAKFWEVMRLNDRAYEYGESKITKSPVTTEEACKKLLASMDRTEDEMIDIIQDILLPESVVRKRLDMAEGKKRHLNNKAVNKNTDRSENPKK